MVTLRETPTRVLVSAEEPELVMLVKAFRFRPLSYFRADSYQLFKATGGEQGWDGYRYPLAKKTRTAAEILRGRKDEILEFCAQFKLPVDTTKLFVSPFADLTVEDVPYDLIEADFALDKNQRGAIVQWLRNGMGIAHFAVNSGKTGTLAGAAAMIKRKYPKARFLYFTPAERLVKQTYDWMKKFLPGWDITQYGGGGKRDKTGKDMVVCTHAILNRNYARLHREGFFNTFYALLLDESQHSQSPSCTRVMLNCAAFFRFAASDSLKESDPDKHSKIVGLCGPVRCTVTCGELIAAGRSARPHIYLVDSPSWKGKFSTLTNNAAPGSRAWTLMNDEWVKCAYAGPVYERDAKGKISTKTRRRFKNGFWAEEITPLTVDNLHHLRLEDGQHIDADAGLTLLDRRYDRAIVQFKARNDLIVEWAKYYAVDKNWRTVVVATRSSHVIILRDMLEPVVGEVRTLTGTDSTKTRDDAFAWFKATPGAVLISSILKEGVSVNEIEAGIIADHVVDFEVARQILGRFMRKKANNECHIVMFLDRQHPRYERNAIKLIGQLEREEGFQFLWPVIGPDTISEAGVYQGGAK